ncbi:ABC transporter permease [Demetria terragena]|uniref:ABC transporter permease n=1 Tax=Demetria terragena TaxID=63959 RepID=UPI00036EF8BC|nr:ABC transporter permease [Demetria terragena]
MSTLVSDTLTAARRNLIKIKRVPDLLVFTTLQPIMFILLFGFVFGSLAGPGNNENYREFLMAGIFAQTIIFGATLTGWGMAEDMQKGVIDRFRTLPMHPGAVLFGRTLSDLLTNVLVLVVMTMTGLLVGWRIRDFAGAVVAYALMLVFAYAVSWIMAFVGLAVRTPEIVNNASFIVIFPLTFIASTFAPAENMPSVLKTIAGWNPVSSLAHAARSGFGNPTSLPPKPDSVVEYTWALRNAEIYTVGWSILLLVVFVPVAIRTYQRAVAR